MKKISFYLYLITITVLFVLSSCLNLFADSSDDNTRVPYYYATIILNDGTNNMVEYNLRSGSHIPNQSTPNRGWRYEFAGWRDEYYNIINFSTYQISRDIIITASWYDLVSTSNYSSGDYTSVIGLDLPYYYDYVSERTIPGILDHKYFFVDLYMDFFKGNEDYIFINEHIVNDIPVEMKSSDFPNSDLTTAIAQTGRPLGYGGCGPIAMIGMLDYLARFKGYEDLEPDPTDSDDRIALAYQVFNRVVFYIIPNNNDDELTRYNNGDGIGVTGTDYVNCFNAVTTYFGYNSVTATNYNKLWNSRETILCQIIQNIRQNKPVTLYTAEAGNYSFASHYVNAYGYEIYGTGFFDSNYIMSCNIMLKARLNWGNEYLIEIPDGGSTINYRLDYLVDPDAVFNSNIFGGVITYTYN